MSGGNPEDDADHRLGVFEAERARLHALAYRMLGVHADADDVVQEAWLRYRRTTRIDRPAARLTTVTTVTTRLAIDGLRSARYRRESYVGPWRPEPIISDPRSAAGDPAEIVELSESVTLSFLRVLDRLEPVDRAVFLLRDVFDVGYDQIAIAVGRSPANCRQIARRARQRVRDERRTVDLRAERREQLLEAFLVAASSGDPSQLEPLLMADVVHISDGGADRRAARVPVVGADRVARLLVNLAGRLSSSNPRLELVEVNGQPGLIIHDHEAATIIEVEFLGDLVSFVHVILNPCKVDAPLRNRDRRS